jgi:hypothetical protein
MFNLLILPLALLLQAPAPAPTLKYDMPEGWTSKPASSRMRVAEFVLPKADGDSEDATLVITYFGGQGGTVQANFDRWLTQMAQPDGRASKDVAKTSTLKANGLTLTIMDLPGTFVAEVAPGSSERHNKPGFHLKAAVIEGKGPFFVRLVGPARTVAKWDASVLAFFKSLRAE